MPDVSVLKKKIINKNFRKKKVFQVNEFMTYCLPSQQYKFIWGRFWLVHIYRGENSRRGLTLSTLSASSGGKAFWSEGIFLYATADGLEQENISNQASSVLKHTTICYSRKEHI